MMSMHVGFVLDSTREGLFYKPYSESRLDGR